MSFDNFHPNRKDWLAPYRRSKVFARSCRNHGSCDYCRNNRLHKFIKSVPILEKDEDYSWLVLRNRYKKSRYR